MNKLKVKSSIAIFHRFFSWNMRLFMNHQNFHIRKETWQCMSWRIKNDWSIKWSFLSCVCNKYVYFIYCDFDKIFFQKVQFLILTNAYYSHRILIYLNQKLSHDYQINKFFRLNLFVGMLWDFSQKKKKGKKFFNE